MRKTKSVNFSLVIPSRSMGRLNLLKNCLLSFFKKADHPEDVEAIVLMDLDDEKYCKRVQEFCNSKGYNVQLIIRKNDEDPIY